MPARSSAGPGRRAAGAPASPAPAPANSPLPLAHPVFLAVALVAALIAALAVTFRLTTPDFWQHLLVGKVIWQSGRVPQEHLWTWASWGRREVLPSWGFAWLLWPFWAAGGVWGLAAWRWLTTLGAYACAWAAARRLGAGGLTPLVVIAIAALSYRTRAQVRPETLAALLLALQIFVLERRRAAGGGALALIAIAGLWANAHISYYLGLTLLGIHLLAPQPPAGERARGFLARADRMPGPLLLAAAIAASFVNPFGWRALWEPFDYFLVWRHEPVYRTISELAPLLETWPRYLRSGLPLVVLLWPALIAARAARRRFDPVEALTCALFTGLALFNQRFVGFLMVANVPYLSRSISEFAGLTPFAAALRPPGRRAAAALVVMLAASLPSWKDPRFPLGAGYEATQYPGAACDFLERHELRGRLFNPYYFGGYIAWRFWPDRSRLPFMDIHQSGTRRDRELYAYAFASADAWNGLAREREFDLALLDGHPEWVRGDRLLDFLDADPGWVLIFRDDAAALYARRGGSAGALADSLGYRLMPGGNEAFIRLGRPIATDQRLRGTLRAELERSIASSALNARALSLLANLDFMDGDRQSARRRLLAALVVEPAIAGVHRRLGYLSMAEGRWREAIAEFDREIALGGSPEDEYARMGEAWEKLGDPRRAAAAWRAHLDRHAGDDAAREALRRLEAGR